MIGGDLWVLGGLISQDSTLVIAFAVLGFVCYSLSAIKYSSPKLFRFSSPPYELPEIAQSNFSALRKSGFGCLVFKYSLLEMPDVVWRIASSCMSRMAGFVCQIGLVVS